ncbi:hypothetical protein ACIA8K_12550 [Catenuloplanes sp. NPDC051500]|uniref:hypothetical protein n=1 Tax=Catenuloplanes sp. NPDC051500 TaxID=3363959 RepID=UPI003791D8CE
MTIPGPSRVDLLTEVPRDGKDRPVVVPEEGGRPIALARSSKAAGTLEDRSNLERYGKRMTLRGAALLHPADLRRAGDIDLEDPVGKREMNRLVERAERLSGSNAKAERGNHLHDLSEYVDRNEPLPAHASEQDRIDMAAYMLSTSMLKQIHIEQFTVCSQLKLGGTPDRVSFYDGPDPDGRPAGNLITDLKTGSVDYGELKMAIQLGTYSRSKFYDHTRFQLPEHDPTDLKARWAAISKFKRQSFSAEDAVAAYRPLPDVNPNWGLIIHLPAGTGQCTVYWINLKVGWAAAQLAMQVRESRGTKVLTPFAA